MAATYSYDAEAKVYRCAFCPSMRREKQCIENAQRTCAQLGWFGGACRNANAPQAPEGVAAEEGDE